MQDISLNGLHQLPEASTENNLDYSENVSYLRGFFILALYTLYAPQRSRLSAPMEKEAFNPRRKVKNRNSHQQEQLVMKNNYIWGMQWKSFWADIDIFLKSHGFFFFFLARVNPLKFSKVFCILSFTTHQSHFMGEKLIGLYFKKILQT